MFENWIKKADLKDVVENAKCKKIASAFFSFCNVTLEGSLDCLTYLRGGFKKKRKGSSRVLAEDSRQVCLPTTDGQR